jgi:hypothetical protein
MAAASDDICLTRKVWEHHPVAELVVEGNQLVLRLSWWERIAAVHGNVRVPLSRVAFVNVEALSNDFLRRLLRHGYGPVFLQVPYGFRAGFFVAARRRRPAVYVGLGPQSRPTGLLVSVADPEATAARIMDAKHGHREAEGSARRGRYGKVHVRLPHGNQQSSYVMSDPFDCA